MKILFLNIRRNSQPRPSCNVPEFCRILEVFRLLLALDLHAVVPPAIGCGSFALMPNLSQIRSWTA